MVLALAVGGAQARAQEAAAAPAKAPVVDVADLSLEDLLNTPIASATKTAQTTDEAPSIVSVITRDQIRDYGWVTLSDILFKQPGFAMSHDYERVTVSARGNWDSWNSNHLLLLIDGVPYNDNETGTAYVWEQTPLFMVKNVEILRGPGSALYGSYAMNGVLALNTVSASELWGDAQVRIGDNGTHIYELVATAPLRYANVAVGLQTYETFGNSYDDFDGSGRTDADGNPQKFPINDARGASYLFAKIDGTEALKGLSVQFHNQSWSFKTGHGWLWWAPDVGEQLKESRQMLTVRYEPSALGKLSQEYVVQYQRHSLDYDMRFYANDAFDGYYPGGLTEVLLTRFDSLFARAQATYAPWPGGSALLGVEYTGFFYKGDQTHFANVNVSDAADGYPPFPNNAFQPLGAYYQPIIGHPVNTIGLYGQFASGKFLDDRLSATAGLRYDREFFQYNDLSTADLTLTDKAFDQLAPRLGVVFNPVKSVTLKALGARAFRAPAPSELFGANTFALGSNVAELKPETVTSFELAASWNINSHLTWRNNVCRNEFENQIAYGTLNLLHNVNSRLVWGAETELLAQFDLGAPGSISGFANYAFVHQMTETALDASITPSGNVLTWFPTHLAKFGALYRFQNLTVSLQGLYQGEVNRRASDVVTYPGLRPGVVPAWFSLDARASYRVFGWARLGFQVSNLLDSHGQLVKGGDFPFDYRVEGRRILGTLEAEL